MDWLPLKASSLTVILALIVAGLIIMSVFDFLSFGKSKFIVDGRTVLLTGGSEGMGLEVGKILSSKGANVVIVARNVQKLQDAIEQIAATAKRPGSQRVHFISADVTSAEENQRILREVTEWNDGNPPDIVWANAGASVPGLFLDTSIETLKSQMDINYFAALYLAHATFKLWLSSTSTSATMKADTSPLPRHFLMTSSVAAFIGLAGYSPYSPAKAALRSLHDTLRSELNLYNHAKPKDVSTPDIKIHTIFPGSILSPGLQRENETKHGVTKMLEEDDVVQTPQEVARVTIAELEKGKHLITTQWLGMVMRAGGLMTSLKDNWLADTILPAVMQLIMPFIQMDLEGKVRKWAKSHGRPEH